MPSPQAKVVGRLALKVLPDTSEFVPRLKAFAERVENQVRIEIPVTLDRKQALAEMKLLKAQLEIAAADDVNIDVGIDGSKARTEMVGLVAQLKAMQAALPAIGSGGGQITGMFGRWVGIFAVVFALVVSIGPALAVLVPLTGGLVLGGLAVFAAWDKVKKLFGQLAPQWKALKAAVGTELVKGMQPFITALGSKFFPVLQSGLVKMARVFNIGFKSLAQWLSSDDGVSRVGKAFDAIAKAMEPFAILITPLTQLFTELSIAAAPALQMVGEALVDITSRFAEWLRQGNGTKGITNAVKSVGEFLKILGRGARDAFPVASKGMAVLLPLLDGMQVGFGVVLKVIKPVFSFLAKHKTTMSVLGASIVLIAAAFGAFALAAAAFSGTVLSVIVATVGAVFSLVLAFASIGPTVAAAWTAVVGYTIAAWGAIKTLFQIGVALIVATWTTAWNAIKSYASAAWNATKAVILGAWEAIKSKSISIAAAITNKILSTWDSIKSKTSSAWNAVKTFISNAWTQTKTKVVSVGSEILKFVGDIPGKIKAFFSIDLSGAGEKLMQGLADGIASIGEVTVENVRKIVQKIRDLLPGSPIKSGPLKSWNRGGAGIRLMSMLAYGIRKGGHDVQMSMSRTLSRISAGTAFAPVFDPGSVSSLTGSMTSQIGAIVDNTTRSAQEIIISNWETGRGVMQEVADTRMAAKEFTAQQAAIMGVQHA